MGQYYHKTLKKVPRRNVPRTRISYSRTFTHYYDFQMYNDYKMSKRAPIAPPRHPSTEKGWVEGKDETAEYAYISPDYVE